MNPERTPEEEQIRRRLHTYPRCIKCGRPMTCGQQDTHLVCREDQQ